MDPLLIEQDKDEKDIALQMRFATIKKQEN